MPRWFLNAIIIMLGWWERYQRYREREACLEAQLPDSAAALQAAQAPSPQVRSVDILPKIPIVVYFSPYLVLNKMFFF